MEFCRWLWNSFEKFSRIQNRIPVKKADGHNLKSFIFFRSLGWSWRICDQGKRHIWSNVWQRLSIIGPKMETHSNSNWSTQGMTTSWKSYSSLDLKRKKFGNYRWIDLILSGYFYQLFLLIFDKYIKPNNDCRNLSCYSLSFEVSLLSKIREKVDFSGSFESIWMV